ELCERVWAREEARPLLGVQSDGHPLQAVDADGPLLTGLAVQRSLLRLPCLLQKLGGLLDRDLASSDLGQDFFFGHGGLQVSIVVDGSFDTHSVSLSATRSNGAAGQEYMRRNDNASDSRVAFRHAGRGTSFTSSVRGSMLFPSRIQRSIVTSTGISRRKKRHCPPVSSQMW